MLAPPSFICPITHELMKDPVTTADGQSYEHEAIAQWLQASSLSPLTGAELRTKSLTRNHALRNAIDEFTRARSTTGASSSENEASLDLAHGLNARKLILLGDSFVGKTSLLLRLKEGEFTDKACIRVYHERPFMTIPSHSPRPLQLHLRLLGRRPQRLGAPSVRI